MFPDRDAVRHDDVQTNIQKKIQKSPMIILSGPTAVGKTRLSIALAKAIGGEIISADSCQVYRHMDIGSAKIMPEEMQGIPHHMIDILEPWEEFSVAVFKEKCEQCLPGIYERGQIPIVTGGTGFYVQALLRDIDFGSGREGTFPEQDNTTPHSVTGDILSAMVCGAGNSPSAADTSACRASGTASMKENNMLPGEASASNGSYRARLEELAESVEQAQAEVARLRQEVRGLKSEIRTVRAEKSQLEHRHDYELEREQARLLEDVKALKQFREQFRRAIEQDARQVLDQARSMGSDRLL